MKDLNGFEPFLFDWLGSLLSPGELLFDIGAHWGLASLFATSNGAHAVAFEPAPVLADVVRYHSRANGGDRIEVVECAVSNKSMRNVPFYLVNGGFSYRNSLTIGSDKTRFVAPHEKEQITVLTISVDDFCRRTGRPPNVIKVDVEGAEPWVIDGAKQTLREARPRLIVSLHEFWMPAGRSERTVLDALSALEYRVTAEHIARGCGVQVRDILAVPIESL